MAKKIKKSKFGNPFDFWGQKFDLKAKSEGWALFDCDGVASIQRIDDPEAVQEDIREGGCKSFKVAKLKNDIYALEICIKKALKGSKMHLLALYLDGREVDKDVDIPPSL